MIDTNCYQETYMDMPMEITDMSYTNEGSAFINPHRDFSEWIGALMMDDHFAAGTIMEIYYEIENPTAKWNFEHLFDTVLVNKWRGFKALAKAVRKLIQKKVPCLEVDRVIMSGPATVVFWKDGTKTVVKAENECFDPEKGLAMALCKKVLGNRGNYYNFFRKWIPHEEPIEPKFFTKELVDLCENVDSKLEN